MFKVAVISCTLLFNPNVVAASSNSTTATGHNKNEGMTTIKLASDAYCGKENMRHVSSLVRQPVLCTRQRFTTLEQTPRALSL
jgi:hypothetical protein